MTAAAKARLARGQGSIFARFLALSSFRAKAMNRGTLSIPLRIHQQRLVSLFKYFSSSRASSGYDKVWIFKLHDKDRSILLKYTYLYACSNDHIAAQLRNLLVASLLT